MDKFVAITNAPHVVAQIGYTHGYNLKTQAYSALATRTLFAVIVNCDFSDHDGVSVRVRDTSVIRMGRGEARLNLNILKHLIYMR